MSGKGIVFTGGINENTKLYRYVGLAQFMGFVETGRLHLPKPESWDDPLDDLSNDAELRDLYCQCWSLCPESDAMWRIYSTNGEGVMIQTTAHRFRQFKDNRLWSVMSGKTLCLWQGILGKVVYYDNREDGEAKLREDGTYPDPYARAYLKRRAFEHEHEVRLVVSGSKGFDAKGSPAIGIPVDVKEFIESVTIDPRADKWHVEAIHHYCIKAGFPFRPSQSQLYSPRG